MGDGGQQSYLVPHHSPVPRQLSLVPKTQIKAANTAHFVRPALILKITSSAIFTHFGFGCASGAEKAVAKRRETGSEVRRLHQFSKLFGILFNYSAFRPPPSECNKEKSRFTTSLHVFHTTLKKNQDLIFSTQDNHSQSRQSLGQKI